MNNIQHINLATTPAWSEVNAATAKNTMSAPQVGASDIPIRDSVLATGKTQLPDQKNVTDTLQTPHRAMLREWQNSHTEVRPGMVTKGFDWNLNPAYPSLDVLNGIATMLVGSVLNDSGSSLKGQITP